MSNTNTGTKAKIRTKTDKFLMGIGSLALVLFVIFFFNFWYSNFHVLMPNNESDERTSDFSEETTKQLLFLSSYAPNFETFSPQYEGISAAIEENNCLLDVFCMNTKKFNRETDAEAFYEYYKSTVSTKDSYDTVIAGDDAALLFIMENQEELFDQIPVVYFAVNSVETAEKASANDYICGYIEPHYLQQTISMAMELQPAANRILCIYDNTETGTADIQNFYSIAPDFPELSFEGLNFQEHTPEEITDILNGLDMTTILLYLSAFIDADGKVYTIPESVRLITEASGTPVYRDGYGGFGLGIAGGKQHDFYEMGYEAASLAIHIVQNDVLPKDVEAGASAPGIYRYDYDVFKKYGLDTRLIPIGAEVLNSPSRELYPYLWLTGIMLLLTASLSCFLIYSFRNKNRAVELAGKLQTNVNELSKMEKDLRYKITHDEMTGLLTRNACLAAAADTLSSCERYSVLLVDIDNMKDLNEAYGHDIGDQYLCGVSSKLRLYCEERKILVGRYGGDEFIMIFPGKTLFKTSIELQEISEIFQSAMKVGNETLLMQASAGASVSSRADLKLVVMEADAAIDEAKKNGKNQIVFQDEYVNNKFETYNLTRKIILDALANDQFYMVYQPQINCSTLEVEGYESLCRIKGNPISPGIFIPIAERYGLIKEIGRITTGLVVQQLAEWRKRHIPLCPVSINLSVYQIADMEYVEYLFDLLSQYHIESNYIILEITESILVEKNTISREIFRRLKEAGIRIHLDDFGTGYSSFGYFSYIDIDTIKIDKSLVDDYLSEKGNVIENLIRTIHSMDKKVIVEGVEEAWQYEKLQAYRCDIIQGYYFSKPLEAGSIENWSPQLSSM